MKKLTLLLLLIPVLVFSARDVNVKTAVYAGGHSVSTTLTISSVSWSTDAGTITLSANVPAGTDTGYVITDTGGNSYLIRSFSGAVITAQDFDSATDPVTGGATSSITAPYSTIQSAEDDFDVTTLYASADTATMLIYNGGGAFDEAITINGGGTVGLNYIIQSVPSTDRHDGTKATGSRIVLTTARTIRATVAMTWEWLEIDGAGNRLIFEPAEQTSGTNIIQRMIVHDVSASVTSVNGIDLADKANVHNSIIYDITSTNSVGIGRGILFGGESGDAFNCFNNTIHDIEGGATSGSAFGIAFLDRANNDIKNNMCTDTATANTLADYSPSSPSTATPNYNLASDDTDTGANSIGADDGVLTSNLYVSTAGGDEDLHIQDTAADQFEVGTDLVTTPAGVNFDIDNFDRNAGPTNWSMGAHDGNNLRGAGGRRRIPVRVF